MAPSFKFGFSRGRRKHDAGHTTLPMPQKAQSDNVPVPPPSHPRAKAERLLGASEPDLLNANKPQSKRQKDLRKFPSAISVTTEIEAGFIEDNGFPFFPSSRQSSRRPSQTLRHQPSSPLLGEHVADIWAGYGGSTDASSPRARHAGSSSTLRSYYDAKKSPLAISQQTSASSARDLALRKGCPPISSPLSQDKSLEVTPWEHQDFGNETDEDGGVVHPNVDITTLFSRPSMPYSNMSATETSPDPHTQRSVGLGVPSPKKASASRRPGFWERNKSKDSPTLGSPATQCSPKNDPLFGAPNWFSPPQDSVAMSEDTTDRCVSKYRLSTRYHSTSSPQGGSNLQNSFVRTDQSAIDEPRPFALHPRTISFEEDPAIKRSPQTRSRQPSNASRKSTRSSRSNSGASVRNLQNESFLALSSSEDEGEDYAPRQPEYRRHRIRASIDKADVGEEALVCSAERVQPIRPRPIVNRRSRHSSRSNSLETIPPVPSLPTAKRPQLRQRTSSRNWQEEMKAKVATFDTPVSATDSGDSSTGNQSSDQSSKPEPRKKLPLRGSKMMQVTAEEEKLLEAMRNKRAIVRKDLIANGFTQAMRNSILRPGTAGGGVRTPASEPEHTVPPLPLAHSLRRSLTRSSFSASTDDLLRDDAFPFPEVPSRSGTKSGGISISPPKPSPSLSFSQSDVLTATPRSRMSPLTPPPGLMGNSEMFSDRISPPRPIRMTGLEKGGHERKRTISSSVVVLDGAEHEARDFEEANDISEWALDRW